MKVVLFCGGQGMRLREYNEAVPKPMVPVGNRPILWHIMKYYAHYGHTDFVLCLGWQSRAIKEYFLNYNECMTNDFVMTNGGQSVDLLGSDIQDWRITFVDTGPKANIGERLMAVREHLRGEKMFLANYADGLTDMPLPNMIDFHERNDAIASFMSIRPRQSFHTVAMNNTGCVQNVTAVTDADVWINGGFFVLNQEIFDHMQPGDELVDQPFQRLIDANKLFAYQHEGYFGCMDTFKEKQQLDDMHQNGNTPWMVWNHPTHNAWRDTSRLADEVIATLEGITVAHM